jgi:hypothetical protein
MRSTSCIALSALLLGTVPAVLSEEPKDLELNQPYQVTVVLDIAKHRLLTPVFRDQVKRELQDGLRTAFGELARVRVVEATEKLPKELEALAPLLAQVRRDGLQGPLDKWKKTGPYKTHFVQIDYVDGQYEVQTRQHDGLTGQASPIVRKQQTSDRQFVARLATFQIDRDFGLVGEVKPGAAPREATIKLKGAALTGSIDRWVQRGDVFILIPFLGLPEQRNAEDVLLVVDNIEMNKDCKCRVFDRYNKTMKDNRGKYRCMRIATIKAPLRVELVQKSSGVRVPNMPVVIRRHGFEGEEGTAINMNFGAEGYVSTEKDKLQGEFDRIAFLSIKLSPQVTAPVPVALVDDRPIKIKVIVRQGDSGGLLAVTKELWETKAYETGDSIQVLFRDLKELDARSDQRDKALKKAKEGLEYSRQARKDLGIDRGELLKLAAGKQPLDLAYGDGWIKFLDGSITRLEGYVTEQERILKEENDPKKLEFLGLVQQAKLEEGRGEFDKALELYDKALKSSYANAVVQKAADTLRLRWEPKNEEHRRARLELEQWAAADLLAADGEMTRATDAFEVLRKNGDVLGVAKLRQYILTQGGKLKAKLNTLETDINEEDRRTADKIAKLAGGLRDLGLKVEAFAPSK